MKKLIMRGVIFGLFIMSSPVICSTNKRSAFMDCDVSKDNNKSQLKNFCSHYFASVILSGCVGAMTGGLLKCFEKQLKIESSPMALLALLLSWSLESEFRNEVIIALQKDLDAYAIGHRKNLMFKSAWIASWFAYLHV